MERPCALNLCVSISWVSNTTTMEIGVKRCARRNWTIEKLKIHFDLCASAHTQCDCFNLRNMMLSVHWFNVNYVHEARSILLVFFLCLCSNLNGNKSRRRHLYDPFHFCIYLRQRMRIVRMKCRWTWPFSSSIYVYSLSHYALRTGYKDFKCFVQYILHGRRGYRVVYTI